MNTEHNNRMNTEHNNKMNAGHYNKILSKKEKKKAITNTVMRILLKYHSQEVVNMYKTMAYKIHIIILQINYHDV